MTKAGRNDPCPCGSGKKYKRCCLEKGLFFGGPAGDSSGSFTEAERVSTIKKLLSFASCPEFDEDHDIGVTLFYGDCLDDRSDDEIREIEELPQTQINFKIWYLFDMDLEEGKTIADLFMAQEGSRLSPGERAYLEKAMQTHFRLYQVEQVKQDVGFELRDLWTEQVYSVREQAATHCFVQWDLMATRLMKVGHDWVIDAGVFNYPASQKGPLLQDLREEYKWFRKNFPGRDDTAFFKGIGIFFNHEWLHGVAFRPLPKMRTVEGDELVFTRVIFDVHEREKVEAALEGCAEFNRHEGGRYVWIEKTPDFDRSLGSLEWRGERLILETTSRERGERGHKLLEQIVGDALRYRVTEYQDLKQAIKSPPKSGNPQGQEPRPVKIPLELETKVMKDFLDKHYRQWLDKEIPALSGRTPRHAVTLKTFRPRVIDLLKNMENMEAHAAQSGNIPYDFGWVWKELGLNREEECKA